MGYTNPSPKTTRRLYTGSILKPGTEKVAYPAWFPSCIDLARHGQGDSILLPLSCGFQLQLSDNPSYWHQLWHHHHRVYGNRWPGRA